MATLVFVLISLAPGDAVDALVGDYPVSPEYLAELRERFGLDRSLFEQYIAYMGQLARGNLGFSMANGAPVLDTIMAYVGNTLLLTMTGLAIASLAGIGVGVWAGVTPRSWVDNLVTGGSVGAFSIPIFWLGQMLILVFALRLGLLPSSGMASVRVPTEGWAHVKDVALHLILPATALAIRNIGTTGRIVRAGVKETLTMNHVWTAQAKGLGFGRTVRTHVLRNALLPGITVIGYSFGYMLAGSVLVETVFGWPGMGRLLYDSILRRDNMMVLGIVIFIALTVLVVNLVTDLIYGTVDPRIRLGARDAG